MLSLDAKKHINFMYTNNSLLRNSSVAMSVIKNKDRQTHKVIKELTDNNIIERIGSNKTGYWKMMN